ncbi:membrane protein [Ktedonobacter sp. SOSP1-52]|uniref:DoxX family protein n=1 Tax=Ktedonobacter sp. SOSP1-52 TaxID=2778366 RepID=UPI001915A372|nr:DoxX family protein [Ktedonobacter sp. SOSP1-52]GHO67989.1 membrane protein [Ktedonobacter sp. SOSP1-52]
MLKTLGRMLLASIFISGGANTFMQPDGRAEKVAAAGIPQPRQAAILNGAVMVVGGSALAAGIAPKLAATALLGALIPTTIVGHPFWKEETPAGKANQQVQFLKNLAAVGGLLLVLADNSHEEV